MLSVIPDKEMIQRIRDRQAAGDSVALISDMYLSRADVTRLLECGSLPGDAAAGSLV